MSIDDIKEFRLEIVAFKQKCLYVFCNYQSYGLETCKWHVSQDLVHDIRDVINIYCLHGVFFEWAHIIFKENYRMTSNRSSTAIEEHISYEKMDLAENQINRSSQTGSKKRGRLDSTG